MCVLYFFCFMQYCCFFVFFFFQAEDGIRDYKVTGVQTCALPILIEGIRMRSSTVNTSCLRVMPWTSKRCFAGSRSGERRVGKECRSRWSPYHYKKQKEKTH